MIISKKKKTCDMSRQQDNMCTQIFKVKCVRYEKLTVFKQKFGGFFNGNLSEEAKTFSCLGQNIWNID